MDPDDRFRSVIGRYAKKVTVRRQPRMSIRVWRDRQRLDLAVAQIDQSQRPRPFQATATTLRTIVRTTASVRAW